MKHPFDPVSPDDQQPTIKSFDEVLSELHFEDVEIIENFIANTKADKTTFASALEFIRNQINNALLEGNYTVENNDGTCCKINFGLVSFPFLHMGATCLESSIFQIKGTDEEIEVFKSKTSKQSRTYLQKQIDLLTAKMNAL